MSVLARAKINLTLHVGRAIASGRFKSYHPVNSLVVFADFGDRLHFEPADTDRFEIMGPFSKGLKPDADNLVSKAIRACGAGPHSVTLEKHIPVSAGLGGGSANAAAVLRAFDKERKVKAVDLGADIPVCRLSQTALMTGIGECVETVPDKGQINAVLINPRVAVSTADIFKAFDANLREEKPLKSNTSDDLLACAKSGKNDLQPIAMEIEPVIETVLEALKQTEHNLLSRMSGSGATCFGLYPDGTRAARAAENLQRHYPDWWVKPCLLGDAEDTARTMGIAS